MQISQVVRGTVHHGVRVRLLGRIQRYGVGFGYKEQNNEAEKLPANSWRIHFNLILIIYSVEED